MRPIRWGATAGRAAARRSAVRASGDLSNAGPSGHVVIRNEIGPFYSWTNAASWRASAALHGSPGRIDPAPDSIPPVLISESLTHTDPPQVDTIELYNPTGSPVPVAGWFLTDDPDQPQTYPLPANSEVPAYGRLLIDETQFNSGSSNSFALSSLGEEIYLSPVTGQT